MTGEQSRSPKSCCLFLWVVNYPGKLSINFKKSRQKIKQLITSHSQSRTERNKCTCTVYLLSWWNLFTFTQLHYLGNLNNVSNWYQKKLSRQFKDQYWQFWHSFIFNVIKVAICNYIRMKISKINYYKDGWQIETCIYFTQDW